MTTLLAAIFVASAAAASSQQSAPAIYEPGQGVLVPRPLKEVKPTYPRQALAARIQGSVLIHAVVMDDGKIVDVTVAGSELLRKPGLFSSLIQINHSLCSVAVSL